MTKITIKLTQKHTGKAIDHPDVIGFDFQIKTPIEEVKFTNNVATNLFIDRFCFLQNYFRMKSFKISVPIRMDVFINDEIHSSYCQISAQKKLSVKWIHNHRFKIKATEYILVPWDDGFNKISKKKKESFISQESYRQPYFLFNTIEASENKFEKYWSHEISTPMYG